MKKRTKRNDKNGGVEWQMWGIPLFGGDKKGVLNLVERELARGEKKLWVATVNPEFVMGAEKDKKFAKLYDGIRHDSGDPIEFTDKVITHYIKLGIDPTTKTIIFSDGLTPKTACVIKDHCRGKIMCSFGIGTNFSNDVGVKPLNMVIKIIEAKPEGEAWQHCIKLSDNTGKHTGDIEEIKLAQTILKIK